MAAFVREEDERAAILHVVGEVDLANANELESAFSKLAARAAPRIVVDLTGCTYLDSTGLRVVARARRHDGDRVRIVVPAAGQLRRIFEVTGLIDELGVLGTVEDSLV